MKSQTELDRTSTRDAKGQRQPALEDVYNDGYLRVEHQNYYAACGGVSIKLPRTEFLLFSRLARSAGRIVTAEELWNYAWGENKSLNTESLHVHIYRLRNKLLPHDLHIDTMVNVGYRLVLPERNTNLAESVNT